VWEFRFLKKKEQINHNVNRPSVGKERKLKKYEKKLAPSIPTSQENNAIKQEEDGYSLNMNASKYRRKKESGKRDGGGRVAFHSLREEDP